MSTKKSLATMLIGLVIALAILLIFLPLSCNNNNNSSNTAESPETPFVQNSMFSKTLNLDWTYEVYLPPSYNEETNKNYPVFYILHGAYGSSNNWRTAANLYANADKISKEIGKEFIIVAIDGMNSFYIDKNIQMESAFVNDLMPYMSSKYRIDNKKESTYIGGLSMGGYGAARFALKYPEKFNGAILLSPAVWDNPSNDDGDVVYSKMGIFQTPQHTFDRVSWDKFHPNSLIDSYAKKNSPVKFYVSTGDADTIVKKGNVDRFVDKLKSVAEVKYEVREGLKHEWNLWKEDVLEGIKFCLS